jgi:hypothetical protein
MKCLFRRVLTLIPNDKASKAGKVDKVDKHLQGYCITKSIGLLTRLPRAHHESRSLIEDARQYEQLFKEGQLSE